MGAVFGLVGGKPCSGETIQMKRLTLKLKQKDGPLLAKLG
jgi:hypothetical protein